MLLLVACGGKEGPEYVPNPAIELSFKSFQEDGVVLEANFVGGCHGNTQGISSLVRGMKIEDIIERLDGIDCGGRGTSCPAQLANALKEIIAND